jgi:hypothetical protein
MPDAFSQPDVNTGNFRFENRKKTGYYNTTQIGMLMGTRKIIQQQGFYQTSVRSELQFSPSVTMTHGILGENWATGIGAGFEMFSHNLFPFFLDLRYTPDDNNISPFFALKTGYAFGNLRKKHYANLGLEYEPFYVSDVYFRNYGGLMLHPEIGVKIPLSEKVDVLFTLAYRYQKIKTKVISGLSWQNYEWEHKESLNRLSFGMAFMFR